jgi:FixJ family two-component response regulator
VTVPENMETIHSRILDDQRIYNKKIAETLEISHESVGYIVHKTLDMRKLPAKWLPIYLNAGQKCV